jgi:RHS repeat-associated protein
VVTTLDWYGRTKETSLTDSGGNDLADTSYDANGNVATVSNPYRSGGTEVYTTYGYDVLGRQVSIKEPDCSGSTCSTKTSAPYGSTMLLTDEAGHQRKLFVDGIGRLTKVLEEDASDTNLGLETDYSYYQNYSNSTYQTIITQQGAASSPQWRVRTFTHDLLGRIVSKSSPEAGTTTYSFLQSSSPCAGDTTKVCSRTDARGVVTTYTYDALSRLTGISYDTTGTTAASTSSIAYYYNQTSYNGLTISDGVGQRTGMSDGTGSTAWSFNALGQVMATRKTLNSITKQANFTYNPDGTLNTLQDFGGTTFTYSYTGAGLPNGITDQTGFNWVSNGTYNAAGQLTGLNNQLTIPYPIVRTITYNNRLQPASIEAQVYGYAQQILDYTYGSPGQNNGNILSIQNGMDGTGGRNQTFTYDNLNRVASAGDTAHWGESYTYDNWGNMVGKSITLGSGYSFAVSSNANNQLSNLTYDSAGDVVSDQLGNSFTYNAEGKIVSAGGGSYSYDGGGNRVIKTNSSGTTLYWPSSVNGIVDESNSSATSWGRQIFLGKLRIWSEDTTGSGRYLLQDHLGSTRVTIGSNGSTEDDLDYRAFGDVVANYGGSPSDDHYVFTGYESDASDSSTDYAQFRNLGMEMGRFTRPDPYDGSYDQTNPQSFNRYSYALNNPLVFTDPSGQSVTVCDNSNNCYTYSDEQWNEMMANGGGSGGLSVDSNGNVICSDGSVCGSVSYNPDNSFSLAFMNFATNGAINYFKPTGLPNNGLIDPVLSGTLPNLGPGSTDDGCMAAQSALAGLAGYTGATDPPGTNPGVADQVSEAAKDPAVQATAGYEATKVAGKAIATGAAERLGGIVGEAFVPAIGWAAATYTVVSAVHDGYEYFENHGGSESCQGK